MNREQQINEMAKVIDKSPWKLDQDFTGCHINSFEIAESLYNADYRKQSEVASDIFTDICAILESHRISHFDNIFDDKLMDDIAELKKKYTKGGDTE